MNRITPMPKGGWVLTSHFFLTNPILLEYEICNEYKMVSKSKLRLYHLSHNFQRSLENVIHYQSKESHSHACTSQVPPIVIVDPSKNLEGGKQPTTPLLKPLPPPPFKKTNYDNHQMVTFGYLFFLGQSLSTRKRPK